MSSFSIENPGPMIRSNVPGLVCAFSASVTTGGTIYAFGIYGDALKKSLQLTQIQLDTLSATFFVAGLFAWIPGIVVDKMGTRFSLMLGGISGATSTLTYWAVARQFVVLVHVVPILFVLAVLICLSCALIIGSIFKLTLICGGPGTRGAAVGVAKGFVGLGAGVYACIFQALRKSDESALDFLPVIAFFFLLCAAFPASILLPTKAQAARSVMKHETTPRHFRTMYLSLFVLAVVIVGSSISELMKENDPAAIDSRNKRNYAKVLLILSIWLGPITSLLYLPRQEDVPVENGQDLSENGQSTALADSLSSSDATDSDALLPTKPKGVNGEHAQDEKKLLNKSYQTTLPKVELLEVEDRNLLQMLQTPSAWLLLWTSTILVGSGTYKTNNMGEMVESLGFPEAVTPAALALFSVAQASARVVTGVVSEAALKWKTQSCCIHNGVPRPFFLVIASGIALLSHLMLAVSTGQTAFVIACTISGLAFGMTWPLMVLIVGDVFGVANHGGNYMFYDGVTKAVGTIVLSQYVAGNVYESHVDPEDPLSCDGPACFRMTHLIVAGLALTGIAASFALQFSTRNTYNKRSLHA